MRIGMIARYDNSGLGTLSWEFARHLKPSKVVLVANGVYQKFPERYVEFENRISRLTSRVDEDSQKWLLEDIDVLLTFETFYSWELVKKAKDKGIKTALVTMFEMTPVKPPDYPDLYLCPSELDLQVFKDRFSHVPSVFIPIPIATDRLIWKERKVANTFIHNASHGGMNGRKGTSLLIDAMKYVKTDVKIIINSWVNFVCYDKRIEVKLRNFRNYWPAWQEGDVLIYPQDYNGISLPVQEAYASGLGIVSTDIYPFNTWLPKELLFAPIEMRVTRASKSLIEVSAAIINPVDIAKKIDEAANMDLSTLSLFGKKLA